MELVSEHMELVLDFIFLIINIVSLVKEKKMSYRVGGWEVKKMECVLTSIALWSIK